MSEAYRLDPYFNYGGPLQRADARSKLAGVFSYVLLVGAVPASAWGAYLALLALVGVVWALSGMSFLSLTRRMAPLFAFGAIASLGALFRPGAATYWSARLLWLDLQLTDAGVRQCCLLLVRTSLSSLAVGLYIATTRFPDTARALRQLGVPAVLVSTLCFVYRYLFVLVDEAYRLDRARAARTLQQPSLLRLGRQTRVHAAMLGSLFLRAYARGERVYQAMAARGFVGELHCLGTPGWRRSDTAFGIIWGAALGAIAAAVWL